jgi:hypothetical protein
MNLKIGTAVKALLVLIGLFLGSDVVDDTKADQIAGAATVLGAVGWDVWETFKLKRQGIVSTSAAANVAAPGSPEKVLKEEIEKKEDAL